MLEIVKIRKNFVNSASPVLDEVSLRIEEGECLALLGPSGCGKTTLLRILAGLETPESGQILLDGKDMAKLGPAERPFHMVFQKHALFPHLSVFENVAFGLRLRKTAAAEIEKRVRSILGLVRMQDFADRFPATLSGGQSQRVALARALVNRPRVLLLDEPFSALDLKLRETMAAELRDLQKQLKLTFIFVTHDQQEAFALSDRVALMRKGNFEQVCTPRQIYENPKSLFAAHFVGSVTRLPSSLTPRTSQKWMDFQFEGQTFRGRPAAGENSLGQNEIVGLVRPEAFFLANETGDPEINRMEVLVADLIFRGPNVLIRARTQEGTEVLVSGPSQDFSDHSARIGTKINLYFRPQDTLLCDFSEDRA